MILKNKKLLLITSLVTLLPIPVGLALKAWFPMDTGMDFGAFYWLPALSLLGAQWLCILVSCIDTGNKERNQKPLTMVLWIVPVLSNFCCGILQITPGTWFRGGLSSSLPSRSPLPSALPLMTVN